MMDFLFLLNVARAGLYYPSSMFFTIGRIVIELDINIIVLKMVLDSLIGLKEAKGRLRLDQSLIAQSLTLQMWYIRLQSNN